MAASANVFDTRPASPHSAIARVRAAAIDVGSNSVHLVVAEPDGNGSLRIVAREKEMVRLGTLREGRLSPDARESALLAIRRLRVLAESLGACSVLAVATQAVREAEDGALFCERVRLDLGLELQVLSGLEEAALIHRAARESMHLEGERTLVVDVGGGSVELAWGRGGDLEEAFSEPLGVLRLTERFVHSDPLSAANERALAGHVRRVLAPHVARLRERGVDRVVGTSGTMLALGTLCTAREADRLHHVTVPATAVAALRGALVSSDFAARRARGLGARADIIVAGAVLVDTLLQEVGAGTLTFCEWALREGVLLAAMEGGPPGRPQPEDVRVRSVLAMAERCGSDLPHAQRVATLALSLFDQTVGEHGLGARERELLGHAALLHDVGHHVSYEAHHKHAWYLIRHGGLRGFTPAEVDILACVARFHRKGRPRRRHPLMAALPGKGRRTVCVLAGIVRLVDALDRGHRGAVQGVLVSHGTPRLRIECDAPAGCDLEMWAAVQQLRPLERALHCELELTTAIP